MYSVLVRLQDTKVKGQRSTAIVVPKVFYKLICSAYHDTVWMVAHQGRDKTIERIKRKFYWNRMEQFIAKYCNECLSCLAYKNPKQWAKAKLGNIECNAPWELVCIDLQGKWKISNPKGFKYTLTAICGFLKFVFIIPLKDKKRKTIARKLWKRVFSIFRIPPRLHSDRGGEFINELIKELTEFLHIKQTCTTAYHPQGNAYAERVHLFINQALAQCVNNDHDDWDDIVSCIMIAHNDCIHAINGISPAEVILGRHLNLPGEDIDENIDSYNPKSYAQKLKWVLAKTQEIVQGKMALKILRNERNSKNIVTTVFNIGEAVRLWQPVVIEGKKAKLVQKWFGPYFIRDIKNEGRVIYLTDSEGIKMTMPVSVNRIWPYPKSLLDKEISLEDKNIPNFNSPIEMEVDTSTEPLDLGDSMSSDDDDEEGNEKPDVITEPDDDNSGHYFPSDDEESSDSNQEPVSETDSKKITTQVPNLVQIKTQLRSPPKLRERKLLSRPIRTRLGRQTKKMT